jgi:hypothetical protein
VKTENGLPLGTSCTLVLAFAHRAGASTIAASGVHNTKEKSGAFSACLSSPGTSSNFRGLGRLALVPGCPKWGRSTAQKRGAAGRERGLQARGLQA